MDIILFLIVGSFLGWIVSEFMEKEGLGMRGNIIASITGALIVGYAFNFFSILINDFGGMLVSSLAGSIMSFCLVSFKEKNPSPAEHIVTTQEWVGDDLRPETDFNYTLSGVY